MEDMNAYTDILQDIAEDDDLTENVNREDNVNPIFIGKKDENIGQKIKKNLPDILAIAYGLTVLSMCYVATKKTPKVNPFDAVKHANAVDNVIETTAEVLETVA